jgi:hypothetical protein
MLSALVLAMSALSVTWRRGFCCEPASPFGLVSPQHSRRSRYQHSSSTRRFRRRPSRSQLRLRWASVAWLRGLFTRPRRRQRRTPRPLRRRSECCNKLATSANSLDPWRWDFGSRISAGMPRSGRYQFSASETDVCPHLSTTLRYRSSSPAWIVPECLRTCQRAHFHRRVQMP